MIDVLDGTYSWHGGGRKKSGLEHNILLRAEEY